MSARILLVPLLAGLCGCSVSTSVFPISVDVEVGPDPDTGIPIKTYRIPGSNMHAGYFDQPLFVDEDTLYVVSDHENGLNIHLMDAGRMLRVTDYDDKDVYDDVFNFGLTPVLTDDWFFYSDGTRIYRLPAGETTGATTFEAPAGELLHAPLHATADGRFLSVTITRETEPGVNYIARIEFATGLVDYLASPVLGTDNPFVDHAQVHPHDPDLVLFAREGSWVLDRVWLWDIASGDVGPVWLHPAQTEAGHEKWNADGSQVYLVQYGQPAYNIPSGINFLDLEGGMTPMGHNTDYYLGHAALSPDGMYVASDTYRHDPDGNLWLVVYDVARDRYLEVTTIILGAHPVHPHPAWSPSGDNIIFTGMQGDDIVIHEVALEDVLAAYP